MDEYIERKAANEALRECVRAYPNSFYNGIEVARTAIRKLPAATDVVPWDWLYKFAEDKRTNYTSDFIIEAKEAYRQELEQEGQQ